MLDRDKKTQRELDASREVTKERSHASNNRQWLELMKSALLYEERATAALVVNVKSALHEHGNHIPLYIAHFDHAPRVCELDNLLYISEKAINNF